MGIEPATRGQERVAVTVQVPFSDRVRRVTQVVAQKLWHHFVRERNSGWFGTSYHPVLHTYGAKAITFLLFPSCLSVS